MQDTEYKH